MFDYMKILINEYIVDKLEAGTINVTYKTNAIIITHCSDSQFLIFRLNYVAKKDSLNVFVKAKGTLSHAFMSIRTHGNAKTFVNIYRGMLLIKANRRDN